MNVKELKDALDQAFARGIDPDTEVVIDFNHVGDGHGLGWGLVASVEDPASPENSNEEGYIWFTIRPSLEEADSRFSGAHYGYE